MSQIPNRRPSRSYIICATPRSGSNLLCEALTLSGVAGMPQEYFVHWEGAQSLVPPADYLNQVLTLGTDAGGVFGMKIMWSGFDVFVRNLRSVVGDDDCPAWQVVARILPDLRWVRITREDKVRQAISLVKARQSGEWIALNAGALATHEGYERRHMDRLEVFADAVDSTVPISAGPPEPLVTLRYDFEEIRSIVTMLLEHERAWESFFDAAGIRPWRVGYEQLAGSYEETTRSLLAEMGLKSPAPRAFEHRVLNRQGDCVNEEWAERFARDIGA